MDVQKAKKLKGELQTTILEMLKNYEKQTGVRVENISLERISSMGIISEIANVTIRVEL